MTQFAARLKINPEIIGQLQAGKEGLFSAAHEDGSDNRINENDVLEAASYHIGFGVVSALAQGFRKAFRNRGKSGETLAAEKEAVRINAASDALAEQLMEYLQDARQGSVDAEALDDLISTLNEVETYAKAGKMRIQGERVLGEIVRSIAAFTAAITSQLVVIKSSDPFGRIRELLICQRACLA